eukprot:GHUV01051944.1.p1 GENE.GHUV01051944.1~~GHUV01051944.1.p1  ORF type:complete len:258 (+),score=99.28 GHUV01051944.1:99-872(+)
MQARLHPVNAQCAVPYPKATAVLSVGLHAASSAAGPEGSAHTDDAAVHAPAAANQPSDHHHVPAASAIGHDSSRLQDAAPASTALPEPAASHDGARPHDAASASAAAAAGQLKAAQPTSRKRSAVPAFSLRAAVVPLYQLLLGLLALTRGWLQYILVRAGVGTAVSLLALHLVLNKVALPLCNKKLLPGLLQQAQAATLREVSAGGVSSVSLAGLLGIGPLVRIQQLTVGPGPVEKSSAQVTSHLTLFVITVSAEYS